MVVVEILSPSTFERGRGRELTFYKSLSAAQDIVPVYSDQTRVEHDQRVESRWRIVVPTRAEELLEFGAVAFRMSLRQVYYELPLLLEPSGEGADGARR